MVVLHYHDYIGGSHVPPFWSLGYHQSRWGYRDFEMVKATVRQFNEHKIPLDTMWSDLDYMQDKAIFTIDHDKYPPASMKQFFSE